MSSSAMSCYVSHVSHLYIISLYRQLILFQMITLSIDWSSVALNSPDASITLCLSRIMSSLAPSYSPFSPCSGMLIGLDSSSFNLSLFSCSLLLISSLSISFSLLKCAIHASSNSPGFYPPISRLSHGSWSSSPLHS